MGDCRRCVLQAQLQEGANEALGEIIPDEAIDWHLVFVPLTVASFVLIWLFGWRLASMPDGLIASPPLGDLPACGQAGRGD